MRLTPRPVFKKNFGRAHALKKKLKSILFQGIYGRLGSVNDKSHPLPSVIYRADKGVSAAVLLNGVHEEEELETFFDFARSNFLLDSHGTALDVGANIGNHSLYFARIFSKVIGFEPNPQNWELCAINCRAVAGVDVQPIGLSDKNFSTDMFFDELNPGASRICDFPRQNSGYANFVRLDDLELTDSISLIKIDVEGHELNVLKGGAETIKRNEALIIFEQHQSCVHGGSSETVEFLRELGYDYFFVVQSSLSTRSKSSLKALKRLKYFLVQSWFFLFGTSYEVARVHALESKFYPFIFAVKNFKNSASDGPL